MCPCAVAPAQRELTGSIAAAPAGTAGSTPRPAGREHSHARTRCTTAIPVASASSSGGPPCTKAVHGAWRVLRLRTRRLRRPGPPEPAADVTPWRAGCYSHAVCAGTSVAPHGCRHRADPTSGSERATPPTVRAPRRSCTPRRRLSPSFVPWRPSDDEAPEALDERATQAGRNRQRNGRPAVPRNPGYHGHFVLDHRTRRGAASGLRSCSAFQLLLRAHGGRPLPRARRLLRAPWHRSAARRARGPHRSRRPPRPHGQRPGGGLRHAGARYRLVSFRPPGAGT